MAEEKYYKLVNEDGKHLYPVENSDGEVWGLFGDDESNQARGAARFVEVEEDRLFGYEEDEYYDYEWQSEEASADNDIDAFDIIFHVVAGALYLAGVIAEIVEENPEIIDDTKNVVNRVKGWGKDAKNKVVEFSNKHFKVKLFHLKKNKPSDIEVVEMTSDIIDAAIQTKESITEEEAKKLVIEMLTYYAEMKKRYDKLKAAKIEGYGILQLEMEEMLNRISEMLKTYPQLMDQSSLTQIIPIISPLPKEEREMIYDTIHINLMERIDSDSVPITLEPERKIKAVHVKVVDE